MGSHKSVRGLFGSLPQFQNNDIVRNVIPCGEDGIWMIKNFDEISKDSKMRNRSNIRISAAELNHVPFVPTFGYAVEDHKPPLKIDPDRAEELGIKPSKKFDELKNGFAVMSDDATREVQPEEVLFDHGFKARKAVILGDLCTVPPPMLRLCRDADVVVHEATLSETDDWVSRLFSMCCNV